MSALNRALMNCRKVFVSGINAKATPGQVFAFFNSFTGDVESIYNTSSKHPAIQNVVITFASQHSALRVIDEVNFKKYDGYMMKACFDHPEIYKSNKCDEKSITIHFPNHFVMDDLTERFIYDKMKVLGPIVNIRVDKGLHMAFCNFASIESVAKAIDSSCEGGVTIRRKTTPRKKRVEKKNDIKLDPADFPSLSELSQSPITAHSPHVNAQAPVKKPIAIEAPKKGAVAFQVNKKQSNQVTRNSSKQDFSS